MEEGSRFCCWVLYGLRGLYDYIHVPNLYRKVAQRNRREEEKYTARIAMNNRKVATARTEECE